MAHLTGVPVIPFALTGTEQVWPRSAVGPNVLGVRQPPQITVTFGPPVELEYQDVVADTERIMAAISELLPPELRHPRRPTTAELASTYPKGIIPPQDRWFASDAPPDAKPPADRDPAKKTTAKKATAKKTATKKATAKKSATKKATAKKTTAKKAAAKKTAAKKTAAPRR